MVRLILVLFVLSYIVIFSLISLRRHNAFYTYGDLGNVDQALWNTLAGRPGWFTNHEGYSALQGVKNNRLGMRVEPIYLFILPFYTLLPTPYILLVLQAIVIALGAFPLYEFGYLKTRNSFLSLMFAILYLLTPALYTALLFDFHAVVLAPTFFILAFLSLERDRYGRFIIFLILAMACKEDVSLIGAMLGLYLMFMKKKWKLGGLVLLIGLTWFCIAIFVVVPTFNETARSPYWQYYGGNRGMAEAVLQIGSSIFSANSAFYLIEALFPTAFLALLAPEILLLALPSLVINLGSSRFLMNSWGTAHYSVMIVAVIVIATIVGYSRLKDLGTSLDNKRSALIGFSSLSLILALSVLNLWFATPHYQEYWWPELRVHHQLLKAIAEEIPADAELSVQRNLNPHFSQREALYIFPRQLGDYILLDMGTAYRNPRNLQDWTRRMIVGGEKYGIVLAKDGYILLKRSNEGKHLSPDFFTFTRPGSRKPSHLVNIPIVESFKLHGYNVIYYVAGKGSSPPIFELFLTVEKSNETTFTPLLSLLDASGNLVGQTELPTTLVWLPTDQWLPSKIYVVPVAFDNWPTTRFGELRLELSMVPVSQYPNVVSKSVCLGKVQIVFGHILPILNDGACTYF